MPVAEQVRRESDIAQPRQPERRIGLHRRGIAECLAEELRRLETDAIYEAALTSGLDALAHTKTMTESAAIAEGEAPSVAEAKKKVATAEESASQASRAAKRARPTSKKAAAKKATAKTATTKATEKKAAPRKAAGPAKRAAKR